MSLYAVSSTIGFQYDYTVKAKKEKETLNNYSINFAFFPFSTANTAL